MAEEPPCFYVLAAETDDLGIRDCSSARKASRTEARLVHSRSVVDNENRRPLRMPCLQPAHR